MRVTARLVLAAALAAASFAASSPASATDCSDPKKGCGACRVNPDFSVERLNVIECYS